MKLAIIGTGYVGLVTGICFASKGNEVTCIDTDKKKIAALKSGEIPIYEPGLKEMLDKYNRNLSFSTDKADLADCDVVFISVGTPMGEDGSADLQYVLAVAKDIGQNIKKEITVVDKSTVPVGTAEKVRNIIVNELEKRGEDIPFHVVSNPEFLKEGSAIDDFLNPDRVVIGSDDSANLMKELYSFVPEDKIVVMDVKSAELTKYASNAMLATKISFINEISNICEHVGADVNKVRTGMCLDKRIGFSFLNPGCGYGGSCFPKDVQALIKTSEENRYEARILKAAEAVNKDQKKLLAKKIVKRFGEDLSNLKFAIWGLAFKPNTDDMREAPSITLIKELQERGAKVSAYDPQAMGTSSFYLDNVVYNGDEYLALHGSDALVVLTEWEKFKVPDFAKIKRFLENPIIFDGRNVYDKKSLETLGFECYQIGVN